MNATDLDKRTVWLKLQLELVWWLVTAGVAYLVLYPLLNGFENFIFLRNNLLFIAIFVTYARYIFLLKHTFLAYLQIVKFVLIFASIPLVFYLIELLNEFQIFFDNEGLHGFHQLLKPNMELGERDALLTYLNREIVFFGAGSIITAVLLPIRLLISFWRVYNKTGNV